MRKPLIVAALLVTTPFFAACTENTKDAGGDSDDVRTVSVTSTDDECKVSAAKVPSGTLTFDVTNDGSQVTEFYLLGEDGLRIVAEVEAKMAHLKNPLRISILGCLVNGFGEAKEADLGIAAGAGKGVIFKKGVPIRHVSEAEMVEALLEEVNRFDEETPALKSYQEKKKSALPILN